MFLNIITMITHKQRIQVSVQVNNEINIKYWTYLQQDK